MSNLHVSIFVKKDIASVLMLRDGMKYKVHVEKIKDKSIVDSNYLCMIRSIQIALLQVRNYIDETGDTPDVVFEITNSTIQKWIYNCYSKEQYQDEFMQMMTLLQELPMKYMFATNSKPRAYIYADEKYIKGVKYSRLEI